MLFNDNLFYLIQKNHNKHELLTVSLFFPYQGTCDYFPHLSHKKNTLPLPKVKPIPWIGLKVC